MTPRIVSLLPSATEIISALGFRDSLVGRSHECDFPAGVEDLPVLTEPKLDPHGSTREIHRQMEALLSEDISVYRVDAERLRLLAPTHVVTQVQCDVCAVSLADVEEALSGCGAPKVVALAAGNLAGVLSDVQRVASALEAAPAGTALVQRLSARMESVAASSARLPRRPRVATIEWLAPAMAAGNWIPELIWMAGGEDVLGEAGRHSAWLAPEALPRADPDVVVVFPCGFSLARLEAEAELLLEIPGFAGLSAVRRGAVYLAEGNQFFNRPGPRLAESLEILAEILHPDAFAFGHEGRAWKRWSPVSSGRS
ncbi:MAG: ABC transporter substrate-binding protein [Acidobacteriota bacterium]|nr:ABC transporter substrate-binding protein [Acidobacteriota bacterium]